MTLKVDWDSYKDCEVVLDWDDGHVPENCTGIPTQMVWRPNTVFHSQVKQAQQVHVQDDALPPKLVDDICQYTMKEDRPWGTYVTLDQVRQAKASLHPETTNNDSASCANLDDMAEQACALYLHYAQQCLFLPSKESLSSIHGIAVWALPSDLHSQVPYHVDYAEQVRYQYNVVVLPLLAGTLHCTKGNVEGGALRVFPNLQHYEKHGYKACKCPIPPEDDNDCQIIEYRYNRLIVMSGHLPHSSTPVTKLPEEDEPSTDGSTRTTSRRKKRVMMGFNVFGHDIGSIVQAAPEHSAAWRRQTKLLRLQQKTNSGNSTSITLESLQQNPTLRKLLVQAKRHRVRDEWRQQYVNDQLYQVAVQLQKDANSSNASSSESPSHVSLTVEEVIQRLARPSSSWPTANDVMKFLTDATEPTFFSFMERPVTAQSIVQFLINKS